MKNRGSKKWTNPYDWRNTAERGNFAGRHPDLIHYLGIVNHLYCRRCVFFPVVPVTRIDWENIVCEVVLDIHVYALYFMSRLIISFFTYPEYGRIVIRTNTLKSGSVLYGSYPEISRKSSVSVPVKNTLKYHSVYQNTADLHLTYWLVKPFKSSWILPLILPLPDPGNPARTRIWGSFFLRHVPKKGFMQFIDLGCKNSVCPESNFF